MKLFSETGQKNLDELQGRMFDEARSRIEARAAEMVSASPRASGSAGIPGAIPTDEPAWKPVSMRARDVMPLSGDFEAVGDTRRALGTGTMSIVSGLASLLELTGAVDAGKLTQPLNQYVEGVVQNMSPSARAALQHKWAQMDENSVWQNPKSALLQLTQQVPQLAVSFGGAGLGLKAGSALAKKSLTKQAGLRLAPAEAAAKVSAAEKLVAKGGAAGATAAGGLTEGTLTAGDAANTVISEIMKLDATKEQKQALVDAVHESGDIAQIGIVAAAVGLAPGYVYGRIMQGRPLPGAAIPGLKGRAVRAGGTGTVEAGQEAIQEGYQAYKENTIAREHYDPTRDPMRGVGERAAAGAGLGFGMGAIPGAFVPPDVQAALKAKESRENPPVGGSGSQEHIPPDAFARPQGEPQWSAPPPAGRPSTTTPPPLRERAGRNPQQLDMFGGAIPESTAGAMPTATGAGRQRGGYAQSLLQELKTVQSGMGPAQPAQRRAMRQRVSQILTELQRLGVDPAAAALPQDETPADPQQMDLFKDQQAPQALPTYEDANGQQDMFPPGPAPAPGPEQMDMFPGSGDIENPPGDSRLAWQQQLPFDAQRPSEGPVLRAETPEQLGNAVTAVTRSAFAPYVLFNTNQIGDEGAALLQDMVHSTPEISELLVGRNPETGDVILTREPGFIKAFEENSLPEATRAFNRQLDRLRDRSAPNDFAEPRAPLLAMPTEQRRLPFKSGVQTNRRMRALRSLVARMEATVPAGQEPSTRLKDLRAQLQAIEATLEGREESLPAETVPSSDTYQKDFGAWDEASKYQPPGGVDVNPQNRMAVFQGREQPWNEPFPVPKPGEPLTRDQEGRTAPNPKRREGWRTKFLMSREARAALYASAKHAAKRYRLKNAHRNMSPEDRQVVRDYLSARTQNGVPTVTDADMFRVFGFSEAQSWDVRRRAVEREMERVTREGMDERKAQGVLAQLSALISEMEQPGQATVPDLGAVAREVDRIQDTTQNPKKRAARLQRLTEREVPTRVDTTRAVQQDLPLGVAESEATARQKSRALEGQIAEDAEVYTNRKGERVTVGAAVVDAWTKLGNLYAGNQLSEQEAEEFIAELQLLARSLANRKEMLDGSSPYAQNLQEVKEWLGVYMSTEGASATDVLREIDSLIATDTGSFLALAPGAGGLANLIAQAQEQRAAGRSRRAEEAKAKAMAELRLARSEDRAKAQRREKRKGSKQLELFPLPRARAQKSLKKTAAAPRVNRDAELARLRQAKAEAEQQRKIEQGIFEGPQIRAAGVAIPFRKMLTQDMREVYEEAYTAAKDAGLDHDAASQQAFNHIRKKVRMNDSKLKLVERVARGELAWDDVLRDTYLRRLAGAAVAARLDIPANRAEALVQEHQTYIEALAAKKKDVTASTLSADKVLAEQVNDILAGQLARAIAAEAQQTEQAEAGLAAQEDKALEKQRKLAKFLRAQEMEEDTDVGEDEQDASEVEEDEDLQDAGREDALADEAVEEEKRSRKDLRNRKGRGKARVKKQVTAKPKKAAGPKQPEAGAASGTGTSPVQTGPSGARAVRANGEPVRARKLRGAVYLTQIASDTPRVVSEDDFVGAAPDEVPFEHQFDGANMILHRINSSPEGSATLLADTAGMGKTGTMMLVATERSKHGPVLIVVNNLQGGVSPFVRDIKRLGANTDNLYFTSYTAIRDGEPARKLDRASLEQKVPKFVRAETPAGGFDTMIADEAHAVKKEEVKTSIALRGVKTKHKLFATATPADKYDSLAVLAEVEGLPLEEFLGKIGLAVTGKYQDGSLSTETMPGLTEEDVHLRLAQRLSKLMGPDSYGFIRRDYELWATQEARYVSEADVTDTAQGKHLLSIERRLRNAYSTLPQTNDQNTATAHSAYVAEAMKVAATMRAVKDELAEGRSVVVLGLKYDEAAQNSPTAGKLGILGETIPSGLLALKAALEAEGIRVATYWGTGGTSTNEQQRADFQSDKVHVMLGQFQKAGQSVDLDAQKEDSRPRSLILMAPPWSFSERQQAVRRVARAGTTSEARIIDIVAPFTLGDQQRMQKLAVKEDLGVTIENPAAAIAREGRSDRSFDDVVTAAESGQFVTVRFLSADRGLLRAMGNTLKDLLRADARTENNQKVAQFSETANSWKIDAKAWPSVRAQLQHVFNTRRGPETVAPAPVVQEAPPTPPPPPPPKRSLKGRGKGKGQQVREALQNLGVTVTGTFGQNEAPAARGFVATEGKTFTAEPQQIGAFDDALIVSPKQKGLLPFFLGQSGSMTALGIPNAETESLDWIALEDAPPAYAAIAQDVLASQVKDIALNNQRDVQAEKDAARAWGRMPVELAQRLSTGKVVTAREALEIIERGMPMGNILGRRLLRRLRLTLAPDTMIVYDPTATSPQWIERRNLIKVNTLSPNTGQGTVDVLHEVVHSVTSQAMRLDAEFRNEVMRLLGLARKAAAERYGDAEPRDTIRYGLTSADEFVAVALTDWPFASFLDTIADPLSQKMGPTKRSILGAIRDTWLSFINRAYRGLNKSYVGRYRKGRELKASDYVSVFESLLTTVNKGARPYDSSVPYLHSQHFEHLLEVGHGTHSRQEVERALAEARRLETRRDIDRALTAPVQRELVLEYNPTSVRESMSELTARLNAQSATSAGRTLYGKLLKNVVLPFMNVAQIESTFGHRFGVAEGDTRRGQDNYLAAYSHAIGLKDMYVQRFQTLASKVHRNWVGVLDGVDKANAERISRHFMDATMEQIWPNAPFDDANGPNHHLMYTRTKDENGVYERRSDEDIADARVHYDRLRAEHLALSQLTQGKSDALFKEVTKYNADEWDDTTFQLLRNVLQAWDFRLTDNEGNVIEAPTDAQKEVLARSLLREDDIAKVGRFDVMRDGAVDGDLTSALQESLTQMMQRYHQRKQGPYFAAKRHGDTVVEATRNPKTVSVGNAEINLPALVAAVQDKIERKLGARELWGEEGEAAYRALLTNEIRLALRRQARERMHRLRARNRTLRFESPQEFIDTANLETGDHRGTIDYSEYSFQLFENDGPALEAAEAMRKEGWVANVGAKKDYFSKEGVEGSTLHAKILSRLPVDDAPLRNAITAAMIELMAETSIKKAELRRKNRAGYSLDLIRGFAEHTRGAAHYKAQLEHGNAITQAMQQLADYQTVVQNSNASDKDKLLVGKIVGEIHQHRQLDSLPYANNELTQGLSNMGFLYMLLSPSYWMIQMTQPVMFGLPVLSAKNKTGRATSRYLLEAMNAMKSPALRRARKAKFGFGWVTGKKVDPELFDFLEPGGDFMSLSGRARLGNELASAIQNSGMKHKAQVIAMMEELGERNLLTMAMHTDMAAAAKGDNPHGGFVMSWARIMPQLSEVFGRSSVAIAAYQIARDGMPEGTSEEEAHTKAVQAAAEAVRDAMFDYSVSNRNRYMSGRQPGAGQLVKLATMFMMHAQHVYALMLRETYNMFKGQTPEQRKQGFKVVTRILGAHFLAAGAIGATFEPVKWAMQLSLMMMQGFDDEPDEPWAVVMERELVEAFGPQVGGALAKGLPYQILGADLHGRLNISSMLFYNERTLNEMMSGRQGVANALLSAVGPLGGIAGNMGEAAKSLAGGDYLRAIEQSTPKMFRDFTKAYRFGTEGMRDTAGNLTSVDAPGIWGSVLTGVGIRTAHEERVATRKSIMFNLQTDFKTQKSNTMEKYKRLWNSGDTTRARQLRVEYNRGVPSEFQITIEDLDRQRKDQGRKEAGVRRDGIYVPERQRSLLKYVKHLE